MKHGWLVWLLAALLAVAAGLAVTACGDDDDDDDSGGGADDDDDDTADDDTAECADADADGYTDAACGGEDCDDTDETINPGAAEICDDEADQNCDGNPNDGCAAWEYETVVEAGFTCDSPYDTTITCYSLAFLADDSPVAAIYDQANGDLVVGTQTATDKGFTLETVDSEGDTGRDPVIDVDSSGRIGIAYYRVDSKEIKVAFKSPGGSWQIYSLGNHGGFMGVGGDPSLRFDANDKANVTAFKYFNGTIYHYLETTQGEWTTTALFAGAVSQYGPRFDFDSAGNMAFVWYDEDWDLEINYINYGFWGGSGDPVSGNIFQATGSTSEFQNFDVVWSAEDVAYAFYSTGSTMHVNMAAFVEGNWDKMQVPDDNQQLTGPIEAARAVDGTVWLSYASDFPLSPRLAAYDGEAWTFYMALDNEAGQYGRQAALGVDSAGQPGVLYMYEPSQGSGMLGYAKMNVQ